MDFPWRERRPAEGCFGGKLKGASSAMSPDKPDAKQIVDEKGEWKRCC
jgi:hypothetical protein